MLPPRRLVHLERVPEIRGHGERPDRPQNEIDGKEIPAKGGVEASGVV